MKLTDLRDELTARADSTDETPDLLDGVRRKIARTKRRRKAGAAGAAGGVAIVAAFAFGILPNLTTSTPQPAKDDVPRDYAKDGLVLRGMEGQDRLEKGWIGDRGQNTLDFSWTPTVRDTRFVAYCNQTGHHVTISVNDHVVGRTDCHTEPAPEQEPDSPGLGINILADNTLWIAAPDGKAARVVARLTDANGRPVPDQETQVALGIYRTASRPADGPPTQAPPTSEADYVKDGFRYRAKVGGDTLVAAKIADRGQTGFAFTFENPGGPLVVSDFCTATTLGTDPVYQLEISIKGKPYSTGGCSGESTDAVGGSLTSLSLGFQTGDQVQVEVHLVDKNRRRVKATKDRIGLGIYAKGSQRVIGETMLDEIREYSGRNYRLHEVRHVPVATVRKITAEMPVNTPYVVSFGLTGVGNAKAKVSMTGLRENSSTSGGGIGTIGEAASPSPKTASVTVTGADKNTSDELLLALYLPD
ncbi:hypothetical protein [Kribbella sp. CA-293567]|uniref:hypothetical protein n=1 Tax=Kribbella sp. CA-293567 TaxID=3002436 RepID=UPI0022DD476A|nr:hypothetical protein [Kribbella sp. CA-293567]WBQ06257.1 hypothetical protein OX958_05515 [Kribbella sp. CA-293567]